MHYKFIVILFCSIGFSNAQASSSTCNAVESVETLVDTMNPTVNRLEKLKHVNKKIGHLEVVENAYQALGLLDKYDHVADLGHAYLDKADLIDDTDEEKIAFLEKAYLFLKRAYEGLSIKRSNSVNHHTLPANSPDHQRLFQVIKDLVKTCFLKKVWFARMSSEMIDNSVQVRKFSLESFSWLIKEHALEAKGPGSFYDLGVLYLQKHRMTGETNDLKMAICFFKVAADSGNPAWVTNYALICHSVGMNVI